MEKKQKHPQKTLTLIDSFNCAIDGFIYVIKHQRNMRIHFLASVFIFILGIALGFDRVELICLSMIICLVLFAEMVNTAVEHTVDLISDSFHPLVRITKDISAGAVLLTAIFATISGYLLFARHLKLSLGKGIGRLVGSPWHITLVVLTIVLFLVVMVKVLFHKGTPARGGMPSGHSAFAFSLWTIIVFMTSDPLIIGLSFIMAVLIARSRLTRAIHSVWELVIGAVLGVLTTTLVIQIFTIATKR